MSSSRPSARSRPRASAGRRRNFRGAPLDSWPCRCARPPPPTVQILGEAGLARARRRDQRARVVDAVGQLGAQASSMAVVCGPVCWNSVAARCRVGAGSSSVAAARRPVPCSVPGSRLFGALGRARAACRPSGPRPGVARLRQGLLGGQGGRRARAFGLLGLRRVDRGWRGNQPCRPRAPLAGVEPAA